jgi:hypothetical protein
MYSQKETSMYQALKLFFTALLLSSYLFTNHALASECYEQSPNLINLGDEYYDFDNIKVFSNDEKEKLNHLFTQLSGKWEGKSKIVDCYGPDNDAEKKVKAAIIKTETQRSSSGSLTMNVKQKIIEDRTNNTEVLTLLDPTNTFQFQFLSDTHLIFSEKYRRGSIIKKDTKDKDKDKIQKLRSSRLIENIYELSLDGGSFTLLRSYYTNGVYTGGEEWTLQAD